MTTLARAAGALLQALLLGFMLFFATGQLVAVQTDARVFRYQAY